MKVVVSIFLCLGLSVALQSHASLKSAEIILADLHGVEQKAVTAQDYDGLIDLLVREVQIVEDEQLTKKEIQSLYKFGHPVLNQIAEQTVVDNIVNTIRAKAEVSPVVQTKMAELAQALKNGKGLGPLNYKTNPYTALVESTPNFVALLFMQAPLWVLGFTVDHTIVAVVGSLWIGIPLTAKLGHVTDYLLALARRPKNGTQKILSGLLKKRDALRSTNCEKQLTRDNVRE